MTRKINYTFIPRDGLVGEWLLDGNTNDTSGNGNNGTATDVSWVNARRGYINKCASFNGSSSRTGNDSITDIGNIFTISLWIKSTQSGSQDLLLDINNNSNSYNRLFIAINRDSSGNTNDGYLCLFGNNGSDSSSLSPSANIGINDGTWKHIVWTRDGNNNNKMYVNGKEIPTTGSIPSGDITSTYMTLGAVNDGNGYFYDGNMCLVRTYNKVLSNSEIQSLYQEGLKKLGPTVGVRVNGIPVYSLPNLEQGKVLEISKPQVGGTYYDQTGSGNNGTATDVSDSTVGLANAMSFNGSSSYIDTGYKDFGTGSFTLAGRLKSGGNQKNARMFGLYNNGDTPNDIAIAFGQGTNSDNNKLSFWLRDSDGVSTTQDNTADSIVLTDGKWHYGVLVVNRNDNTVKMYTDGILTNNVSKNFTGTFSTNNRNILIGASTDNNGNVVSDFAFNGQIGLTKIYNRVLSPIEVQQLYYSQIGNLLPYWAYKRSTTIDNSNNSNALTDYQVKIDLDNSNFDFTKANSDGSDIRFYDNDDSTPLNYWIESWDNSNQKATIWVKVPSIPASSSKDIYMYYGNVSASDTSNGDNTFIFFDGFEGGTTKWTCDTGNAPSTDYAKTGSYSIKLEDAGDNLQNCFRSYTFPSSGVVVKRKWVYYTGDFQGHLFEFMDTSGGLIGPHVAVGNTGGTYPANAGYLAYYAGDWYTTTYKFPLNQWVLVEIFIDLDNSNFDVYIDGTSQIDNGSFINPIANSDKEHFTTDAGKGNLPTAYVDNTIDRKYASSEPTTSVGAEQ